MCNLVIKMEVSYQFSMFLPWPWARAQQPQHHQEAAEPTGEEENAEAIQQHQQQHIRPQQQQYHPQQQHQTGSQTGVQHSHQSMEGAWRHHSADLAGNLPQQQSLEEDWYHVPALSAADDYDAPTHSSLSPGLAQEKLEVSQQSHALRAFKPGHMRGFAASALLNQASSSSSSGPATSRPWGRDRGHAADSPVTGGQTRASSVLAGMGPATSTGTSFEETHAHQVHVAEEEHSQGCSQDAIAEQPQERRMARRSFTPAALMRRILGTPRRNRENGGLARAGSSNVGRMSAAARTDLADASAMPATN
jgi:hypothetical protein